MEGGKVKYNSQGHRCHSAVQNSCLLSLLIFSLPAYTVKSNSLECLDFPIWPHSIPLCSFLNFVRIYPLPSPATLISAWVFIFFFLNGMLLFPPSTFWNSVFKNLFKSQRVLNVKNIFLHSLPSNKWFSLF